ncbi:MAG: hypothetical protein ACC645_10680 [Pirellulales bacterium]
MPIASPLSVMMMRPTTAWLVVLMVAWSSSAVAQRVQFPTMVSQGSGTSGAAPTTQPSPTVPPTTPPLTSPVPGSPPPTTYTPQPALAPTTPPATSPPPTTYGGAVQPAPGGWDPYATPGPGPVSPYAPPPVGAAGQPPSLFPEGFSFGSSPGTYGLAPSALPGQSYRRFFQEIRFESTWLPSSSGTDKLGVTDFELFGTMAFPLFRNKDTPLLVTPGFAVHYFDGPLTTPANPADLPPRTYDAYIDLAWQPRITPWLGADLGFRTGVYSDFTSAGSDTIRFMGRGLGIITLTPATQLSMGVVYLDRNKVKILPAGGVIWTPSPDRRWEIVFPNPKFANRFREIGTTQWWWYVSGEYGGGSWAIERNAISHGKDTVDYNDIRVMLGLEWIALSGVRGFVEVGYAFDRELVYRSFPPETLNLKETIMLRSGVSF